MRAQRLDLGLAIAACARGFVCGRYSDENETLCMYDDELYLMRERGKDAKFVSIKSHDWFSKDWYVIGDVGNWFKKEPVRSKDARE